METTVDITIEPSPDPEDPVDPVDSNMAELHRKSIDIDPLSIDSLPDPNNLSRKSSLRASITSVDFSKAEFHLEVSFNAFGIQNEN